MVCKRRVCKGWGDVYGPAVAVGRCGFMAHECILVVASPCATALKPASDPNFSCCVVQTRECGTSPAMSQHQVWWLGRFTQNKHMADMLAKSKFSGQ